MFGWISSKMSWLSSVSCRQLTSWLDSAMAGGTKRPGIVFLSAVILVSPVPIRLARFYSDLLDVPLRESRHDGSSDVHYECEVADVHFAIHELSHLPWVNASGSRVSIA